MRYYLAITTSVLAFTSASLVRAEDCAITDCSALGYTESSNRGNCLKCPFGNAWACPVCKDSFKYTCTGENEIGGNGSTCGGKYESCLCSEEYVWNGISCQVKVSWGKCNGSAKNCNIGDILYSDGTCSPRNISGKTPIAVVVYKSTDGNCAQAMALNSLGNYVWGPYGTDVPTLTNFTSAESASYDLNSCANTQKIMVVGGKSKYPAAWAAHEYKTVGTEAGDWCLPAAGIMTSIHNNIRTINNGFYLAGGDQIVEFSHFWSSSEYDSKDAWYSQIDTAYGVVHSHKRSSYEVLPVIEF